jgi:hypothetical protein
MPTDASPPRTDPKCEKCGKAAALLWFIPRFGDQPAYRIFECGACKALMWVAQAITGSDSTCA